MKRKGIIGLAVLCALVIGAVAAQGAQAAGYTAFTCTNQASGFEDAHCAKAKSGGGFGHTAIKPGVTTELTAEATTAQVLEAEPFGLEIVLTGQGLQLVESTIINTDHGSEPMDVSGTARLTYSEVVTNLEGCAVEDPVHGAETVTTEPLSYTSQANGNIKLVPASGTTFAVIHMVNAPGKTCILPGEFKVEGGFVEANPNGATLEALPEQEELTLLGAPARYEGTGTLTAGLEGETHNPVALTEDK